jgi:RNA polymerase sigma-70 factor (ECF subfamily)
MADHTKQKDGLTLRLQDQSETIPEAARKKENRERDDLIYSLLKQRDETGLEKLIQTYQSKLFSVAMGICKNTQDAEEVLQDTYLTAMNKVDSFEGRSSLYTWLYRITVNFALMKKRKTRKNETLVADPEEVLPHRNDQMDSLHADVLFQEDALFVHELSESFFDTLDALPEIYRPVAMLNTDGYTAKEMGKILGLTPAAVKSRLHRTRRFFREHLKEYFSEN